MSGGRCAVRYPILLIHGTGFRDSGPVGCWGRKTRISSGYSAMVAGLKDLSFEKYGQRSD